MRLHFCSDGKAKLVQGVSGGDWTSGRPRAVVETRQGQVPMLRGGPIGLCMGQDYTCRLNDGVRRSIEAPDGNRGAGLGRQLP
jgi:hypothetical protein